MPAGFITVKVGRLPGQIGEVALNGDRTVSAALSAASLNAQGYQIRVNGSAADMGTRLQEGDTILLTKAVTGN